MKKRFPIIMPITMVYALKKLAIDQERSVSDIIRSLATAHLLNTVSPSSKSNDEIER